MKTQLGNRSIRDYRVAGVVILYNPDNNIIENINSYISQVEFLFIIDNSEKINSKLVEFSKVQMGTEYIFNNKNIGIASALNLGANKAIEKDCDFILTMDQDSKAPSDLVESLLSVAKSSDSIAIVSPLHSNQYNTHIKPIPEVSNVMAVMTSGNLLALYAYIKAGKFCEEYFIDYVDIEYCIRLNYYNFKILQLNRIILEHNEGNISEKKFLFMKFYPPNNASFRMYYKTRNLLYLRKKFRKVYPEQLKLELKVYMKNFFKILLFEKNKLLKAKMILIGIYDYLRGEKGRKF